LAGGIALGKLDDRLTVNPPDGAAPFSVTLPVDEDPAATEVGLTVRLIGVADVTVSVPVVERPPAEAVITVGVCADTGFVAVEKVVVVNPWGTVTVAGGFAHVAFEVNDTTMPPVGALPLSVMVPLELNPPTTVPGENVRLAGLGGVTVSIAVAGVPPAVAVTVAIVDTGTGDVLIEKVTDVNPVVTVTTEGTITLEMLELRCTNVPDDGAGPFKVTVPVDFKPPATEVGEMLKLEAAGGMIEKVAVSEATPSWAVIVTGTFVDTGFVVTENVADVAPAGTTTLAGTAALVEFDDRLSVVPPVGAGLVNRTVPVRLDPPVAVATDRLNCDKTGGLTVRLAVADEIPTEAVMVGVVIEETGVVVI